MKCRFGIIEILCLLSYLSIALPIQAQSQTQIHLQGNVKDAKTNELLEFATVLLKNDSVQFHAISDTKGSFSIKKSSNRNLLSQHLFYRIYPDTSIPVHPPGHDNCNRLATGQYHAKRHYCHRIRIQRPYNLFKD